jgi:hypothetical protein
MIKLSATATLLCVSAVSTLLMPCVVIAAPGKKSVVVSAPSSELEIMPSLLLSAIDETARFEQIQVPSAVIPTEPTLLPEKFKCLTPIECVSNHDIFLLRDFKRRYGER